MNSTIDPDQIRRREHFGVSSLLLGGLALLAGIITLWFVTYAGLTLTAIGLASAMLGAFILQKIPDVIASPDEFGRGDQLCGGVPRV